MWLRDTKDYILQLLARVTDPDVTQVENSLKVLQIMTPNLHMYNAKIIQLAAFLTGSNVSGLTFNSSVILIC